MSFKFWLAMLSAQLVGTLIGLYIAYRLQLYLAERKWKAEYRKEREQDMKEHPERYSDSGYVGGYDHLYHDPQEGDRE